MIGNLKSVSGYLERRLNTEHDKARHSEAAHQPQSFSTNSRISISNYIRLIAHGYSFSTVGDLFVVLESLANKTFNHVVRMLVARLYDVYVRLPLSEKKWKLELRGFIENYEFPCIGVLDGFHVLCISMLKQSYNLKKRYSMTNLELVENNIF